MPRTHHEAIPWADLSTVFLDAGNTLISIDFEWVCDELAQRGVSVEPEVLRRSEAAARPAISRGLRDHESKESLDAFSFYLAGVLAEVPALSDELDRIDALVGELAPILRPEGRADLLWNRVMPGVPEALETLRAAGLQLAVVSNSDGSVERTLIARELRQAVDAVFDSKLVGYEKPDPRLFEHALDQCGADPSATLHVGDLYVSDIEGARAAGLHALLLDPFDDWGEIDCARLPDLTSLASTILGARVERRGGKR